MKGCYIIVLVVERYENKTQGYALLAQLVEQRTLNPSVQGSNPCVPTNSKSRREIDGFFIAVKVIPQAICRFGPRLCGRRVPCRYTCSMRASWPVDLAFER